MDEREGKRRVVADASPLIALAKLQRLRLLNDLYGVVLICPAVKGETIDAGRAVRAGGVEQIETALEDRWLRPVRLTAHERDMIERLAGRTRLGRGETESIALASARRLRLIVDDKEARSVAAAARVEHLGTAGTLLEAHFRQRLDFGELEAALSDLADVLWLSPAVVVEVLRLAREEKK